MWCDRNLANSIFFFSVGKFEALGGIPTIAIYYFNTEHVSRMDLLQKRYRTHTDAIQTRPSLALERWLAILVEHLTRRITTQFAKRTSSTAIGHLTSTMTTSVLFVLNTSGTNCLTSFPDVSTPRLHCSIATNRSATNINLRHVSSNTVGNSIAPVIICVELCSELYSERSILKNVCSSTNFDIVFCVFFILLIICAKLKIWQYIIIHGLLIVDCRPGWFSVVFIIFTDRMLVDNRNRGVCQNFAESG